MKRTIAVISLVLMIGFMTTACDDNDLKKASDLLEDFSVAVGTFQTVTEASYEKNFLTAEQALSLTQMSIKLNRSGLQISEIVNGLNKLDSTNRDILLNEIESVIKSIDADKVSMVGGLDPEIKAKMELAIEGVKSVLVSVKVVISSAKVQT